MSCTCQSCRRQFRVDLNVPDEMWARISPKPNTPGAGLLCGPCIMEAVETLGEYDAYSLVSNVTGYVESLRSRLSALIAAAGPFLRAEKELPDAISNEWALISRSAGVTIADLRALAAAVKAAQGEGAAPQP